MVESNCSFPCVVCDTSFIIAFLLNGYCNDESKLAANFILQIIQNNSQIYVPELFWYEVNNVLLYKSRPDSKENFKLSESEVTEILYDLQQLPIYTDTHISYDIQNKIRDLAREYNLSFYNASYVELARRYNLELKTFDKKMQAAAD